MTILFSKQRPVCKKAIGNTGPPGICDVFDFAGCGEYIFCTFAHDRGLFSVIFLHFVQKYRCAPTTGFLADIFSHVPSFTSEVSLCT